ncbi:cation transporter [Nostoc linckia z18]|jgi:cation diffusion facilitator family transporter|uniref:Cation transporter n=2 Tax=Nostoc linckia TaxID=92942 RepID=A0A9Q5Z897_NOSLI|nr:cation diffusion facilitator family transporter [Nostoc linckia]PHK39379.1 cation transporter [Nostoc linckia z15]PHK40981.1 cation transporter [Nostoc linckia z16]PHJ66937.1 cation transporter [Nostoc linckia z1]PHJ67667.1 cation transporter [Nostoc linckia z3]PHJ77198.1 cation transporter [Nostoc linckia z2]
MISDNRAEVRKVLIITLILNLFVMGLKAIVGSWTGSLSLLADALHSVTDSANNVLGLIASKFSSPQPDREHPYGHSKFEAVGALGIAAFLGIACFEILQGAIERILKGGELVKISLPELWLLLIVLGINIFVAFYERGVGRRVGSPILIADATHTMSDIWVTISVIGGLIGVWLGYQWMDVVLAFPVALLVFWSGWSVLKENLPWLVDQMAIAPEVIHAIATSVPGVINCHDIASRGVVGRQVFIEMHLIVEAPDVQTAHQITEQVESLLEERFRPVRILIHVEPPGYKSEQISFENKE